MYKRNSIQQAAVGIVLLLALLVIWLVKKDVGDMWILSVFGIFFISSGAFTMVRVHNEMQAYKDADDQASAEDNTADDEDAIAAARALQTAKEEE